MREDRDQAARRYAANLLNRLDDQAFDHRDVAVLARIIPLLEADLADWLHGELRGVVSRFLVVSAVREGRARPLSPSSSVQPTEKTHS